MSEEFKSYEEQTPQENVYNYDQPIPEPQPVTLQAVT